MRRQYLICKFALNETVISAFVLLVQVWMVLLGLLAPSFLDCCLIRIWRHTENLPWCSPCNVSGSMETPCRVPWRRLWARKARERGSKMRKRRGNSRARYRRWRVCDVSAVHAPRPGVLGAACAHRPPGARDESGAKIYTQPFKGSMRVGSEQPVRGARRRPPLQFYNV